MRQYLKNLFPKFPKYERVEERVLQKRLKSDDLNKIYDEIESALLKIKLKKPAKGLRWDLKNIIDTPQYSTSITGESDLKVKIIFRNIDFVEINKDHIYGISFDKFYKKIKKIDPRISIFRFEICFDKCLFDRVVFDSIIQQRNEKKHNKKKRHLCYNSIKFTFVNSDISFLHINCIQSLAYYKRLKLEIKKSIVEAITLFNNASDQNATNNTALDLNIESSKIYRLQSKYTTFDKYFTVHILGSELGIMGSCVYLEDCIFSDKLTFNNIIFNGIPLFSGSKNIDDISMSHVRIKNATVANEKQFESIRLLKNSAVRRGDTFSAYEFSICELEARYNCVLRPASWKNFTLLAEQGFSWVYWIFCDRGRSLVRPLGSILVLAFFFSLVYQFMPLAFVCDLDATPWRPPEGIDCSSNYWISLTESLKRSLGPFGLLMGTNVTFNYAWVHMMGFIQQVVSSVLLFLWILQVRARFRL